MSCLDGALWNMLCPTASPHVSLLFQARGKCLSITMVYYVCACIHGKPRTFLFTCVGKKAENIGRQPLSTSPQTCCPLTAAHVTVCSCVSQPVTIMGWAADVLGLRWPAARTVALSKKKIIPFLFICVFFLKNESITRFLREITILDERTVVYHPKFEDKRLADPRRKSKTQPV